MGGGCDYSLPPGPAHGHTDLDLRLPASHRHTRALQVGGAGLCFIIPVPWEPGLLPSNQNLYFKTALVSGLFILKNCVLFTQTHTHTTTQSRHHTTHCLLSGCNCAVGKQSVARDADISAVPPPPPPPMIRL